MQDSQRTPSERDALFAILADPRRRRLLDVLETRDPGARMALSELADRLAAAEGSTSGERRHDVAAALHHVHLPKLDDAGLVEYDPTERVVEATELSDGRSDPGTDVLLTED
ncbi:hypothetical protein ACFQMA_15940 [Halosimplex aquaticum]|uniref:DUF7344 domain-containing protein n=1 Tax=Halosimplex aquaticum TaxID=3026162 RepID=A0ABD5Y348_9EURY|nr:hypothetical protein [Halosimplex aquaticum]